MLAISTPDLGDSIMKCGGIVLCGGQSRRMGTAKALLPFGSETMLQRVVRILSTVVDPIIVVAAAGQELPALPDGTEIVRDREAGRGPLEGLRNGLGALLGQADLAYATGCDVPLLLPQFVAQMISLVGDSQIVVPTEGKFYHPLAAVYSVGVLPHIDRLLSENRLRPAFLYELASTRRIPTERLRTVDPPLGSLMNINRPEDHRIALDIAGLTGDVISGLGQGAFGNRDV